MNKKNVLAFAAIVCSLQALSQSACTDGPSDGNQSFFTFCQSGSSYTHSGNYSITIGNGITMKINGNVTINGTLSITMVGSTSILEVLSPYTLHATNMTFSGSATAKNLVVDGPSGKLLVDNTLDFGGLTIDLDGAGSILAGTITGADNISCNSDGSCPSTIATSCSPSNSTFCTSGGFTLPIELSSFGANALQESVALSWSTASELNFDYFSLQRSADGKNFNEIAQVKGHGTTNESHHYLYEDTDPVIGRAYYRLTSHDFDGYEETFRVIAVEFNGGKKLRVSPNPSDGSSVKLGFNFANDSDAMVTVFDNLGSVVGTYQVSSAGSIQFENALKGGVYLIKYTSSSFTTTERLLVR